MSKCQCTMSISEERAENEKLQAQVAMQCEMLTFLTNFKLNDLTHKKLDGIIKATEQDVQAWKQQVRDGAYEAAAITLYETCVFNAINPAITQSLTDAVRNLKNK